MKVTVIIAAGGKGTRIGAGKNKVFLKLIDKEVLYYTISAFENNRNIDDIIVVTSEVDIGECESLISRYNFTKIVKVIKGGKTRQESVIKGLRECDGDIVLIHDGARAFVTDSEIDNTLSDCIKYGAAAVGVKCKDTLKISSGGFIKETVDRENTYLIQTPQAFQRKEILSLHEKAFAEGLEATDDCMIAEHYGVKIKISEGSYDNIKLTTPEDMIIGESILKERGGK